MQNKTIGKQRFLIPQKHNKDPKTFKQSLPKQKSNKTKTIYIYINYILKKKKNMSPLGFGGLAGLTASPTAPRQLSMRTVDGGLLGPRKSERSAQQLAGFPNLPLKTVCLYLFFV